LTDVGKKLWFDPSELRLANSPLVGEIKFYRSNAKDMTTKQHEYSNRLTSISSLGVASGSVAVSSSRQCASALTNSLQIYSRVIVWLLIAVLARGFSPVHCAAEAVTGSNQLAITSIAAQGTNLLLVVSLPPGLEAVALETRLALDAPWEKGEQRTVPAGGGKLTFVFPQSAEMARFFRVRGSPALPVPQLLSGELEFVATERKLAS
jgi:hypothetical protein